MDRVTPPPFKKSLLFTLPDPERITLNNGIEILYIPSNLSQVIKLEFVFRAGKIHEPSRGIAQFTTQLLDKGIPGKNAKDIAHAFDYYGAHMESHVGFDFVSISLYCLKKDLKNLLPIYIQILTEPTFPEDELNLYKELFTENLKVNLQKNSFLASNEIRHTLFGDHPYGTSISEIDSSQINLNQLKTYFNENFYPYKILVVGNIEPDDLKKLAEFPFNKVYDHKAVTPKVEKQKVIRRDVIGPNHTQASIRLSQIIVNRKHPDIAGVTLINHILGGFFGSRLMKNIREEKGLTYGIYSGIQHLDQASWLTISADVNAEKVDEAVSEIQKELTLLSKFNDQEELILTQNHLIGSLQTDNATVFSVADRIKNISLNELDKNYYQKLINEISNLNSDNIKKLSSKFFNPGNFSIVVIK